MFFHSYVSLPEGSSQGYLPGLILQAIHPFYVWVFWGAKKMGETPILHPTLSDPLPYPSNTSQNKEMLRKIHAGKIPGIF